MKHVLKQSLLILLASHAAQMAEAAPARAAELRVQLFGQPCLLQGPLEEESLKRVHAISPEQLFPAPAEELTLAQLKAAASKLQSSGPYPAALDPYRAKLGRRLDAQIAFSEAREELARGKKDSPALSRLRKLYKGPAWKALEAGLRKGNDAEKLSELFFEGIEPDPEEDFHRGIQRLGIRYDCAFEEQKEAPSKP